MRLELAERLRCPASQHAPTPLVVVAREVAARDLRAGIAGCPVCSLEARITAGDLWFGASAPSSAPAPAPAPADGATRAATAAGPSAADVERLVALLGLADPGGAVLLTPAYAPFAPALESVAGVTVVLHEPATRRDAPGVAGVAAVRGLPDAVPFTDGTFRAAVLDADAGAYSGDAVRCLVPQGRVVGAASLAVPPGVTVLARDAREWVGERGALPGPIVPLGRRGR